MAETCKATTVFRGREMRCVLDVDHVGTLHGDGHGFVWDDNVDVHAVGEVLSGYAKGFDDGYLECKRLAAVPHAEAPPTPALALTRYLVAYNGEGGFDVAPCEGSPDNTPYLTDGTEVYRCNAVDPLLTALADWQKWAQFVYLRGGLVTKTDSELRAGVCETHDADVAALRAQLVEKSACGSTTSASQSDGNATDRLSSSLRVLAAELRAACDASDCMEARHMKYSALCDTCRVADKLEALAASAEDDREEGDARVVSQ